MHIKFKFCDSNFLSDYMFTLKLQIQIDVTKHVLSAETYV
jgi:hypothetical protein